MRTLPQSPRGTRPERRGGVRTPSRKKSNAHIRSHKVLPRSLRNRGSSHSRYRIISFRNVTYVFYA